MRKKLRISLITAALCALCAVPAHALEYRVEAPADYLFAQATSDTTIYGKIPTWTAPRTPP